MLTFLAVLLILTPLTAFVTKQPRYFQSLSMTQASASSKSATSTVIFDIDGTLADSFELGFSATQTVLPADVSITHEDYHAHTIYPTPERLARHYYQMPIPNGEISDGPSLALELGLVASKDEFIETGTRLGLAGMVAAHKQAPLAGLCSKANATVKISRESSSFVAFAEANAVF